jgi:hypothetical protein
MDQQALQELIGLFLKVNPQPSDQQFHAFAEAIGIDKETLESIAYAMLGEAEDLLEDPVSASLIHQVNANARLGAATVTADQEEVLDDPTIDPDDLSLSDVALNDGDPTDDDLGQQEEALDDGYTEDDVGVGLTNNVQDVLNDDGVIDREL